MSVRQEPSIAIDGPAAAGKSTVGRGVAEALGFRYLDTGLMYRAVTFLGLARHIDTADGAALAELASSLQFGPVRDLEDGLLVNGKRMKAELRTPDVEASVSAVSANPEVRRVLVERQREMARDGGIVMVGRDIGTVVLPQAEAKLWVTASPQTRAGRRRQERSGAQDRGPLETELARIRARDTHDSERAASPLRQADDAIVLETDGLTRTETVQRAVALIKNGLRTKER
jgi:cytidylate kinase